METPPPHRLRRSRLKAPGLIQDPLPGNAILPLGRRAPLAAIVFVYILSATSNYDMKNAKNAFNRKRRLQKSSSSRHLMYEASADWLKNFLNGFEGITTKDVVQPRSQASGTKSLTLWSSLPFELDSLGTGGAGSQEGEYPFYVHSIPSFVCGGTLIHQDIILTAAQCSGLFINGVVVGGIRLDGSDGRLMNIEAEAVHPEYDSLTGDNNIMLVKLAQTTNASVVVLNFDDQVPIAGEALTTVGYAPEEAFSVGGILQSIGVETYTNNLCDISDSQLCTGAENAEAIQCAKDRGGPLLASDKTQVGIITFERGPPCDDPSIPRIYERVSAHGSFIQASICMLSSEPPKYCEYTSQLQARIAPLSPSLVPSAAPTHISQAPSYGFQAESLLPTVPLGENTPSAEPSISISLAPSIISLAPTTETRSPVGGAASPTASPSNEGGIPPILLRPTVGSPTVASPTATQTSPPTIPPDSPTEAPSAVPTNPPGAPTGTPSNQSTDIPGALTEAPSDPLTNSPGLPTGLPTQQPTVPPGSPTEAPASATGLPTLDSTGTLFPTASAAPTFEATTFFPTAEATTQLPSPSPTSIPTFSNAPSVTPSLFSSSKQAKSKKIKGTKSNKGSKGSKQSKSTKAGEGKGKGRSGGKGKGGKAGKSLKGSGTRGDTFVVVSDQELLEIAMRLFEHQASSSSSTAKQSAKKKSIKERTVGNDTMPRPTTSTSENMFLRHPLQQN